MAEQLQTYTLDDNGQPLTIHQDGVTMPADYSFACVNDYVHDTGRHFEELQGLALGMSCEIDRLRDMLAAAPAAPISAARRCPTMQRPVTECGCPDCGSSLIDWPELQPDAWLCDDTDGDGATYATTDHAERDEWVRDELPVIPLVRIDKIPSKTSEKTLLWAVHTQGPDELWAAENREEAEQHAAALNALPGQTDTIKVNAVVIPSPWSEVEHWKTLAEQWRHEAEDRIASLQGLSKRVEKLETARELLHSTDMAKTMDIVTIGEALGIPGDEQQGGIAEFIEEIERLRQFERICEGLSQDCIDGGYTVAEHRLHCKRVEDELDTLRAEHEQLRKDAERYRWLRDHEATCSWEEGDTEARNHPGSLDEAVDESIAMEAANA